MFTARQKDGNGINVAQGCPQTVQYFRCCTIQLMGTLLVAQLVEAPRYKPEGRGFDSGWCHWKFLLT
jgi:hypothetical protein